MLQPPAYSLRGESASQLARQNDFTDSAWRPTGSALKSYGLVTQAEATAGTRQQHGKSLRGEIKAAETSQRHSDLITRQPPG